MADYRDRKIKLNLKSQGSSGLRRWGGYIAEETLPRLTGKRAIETYREMVDNDPICGSIIFATDKLCRGVKWRVKEASQEPRDLDAADFLESCMHDMEMAWVDFISEVMTMCTYGHSIHEKVYKLRAGDNPDPRFRSRFSDGRIGWRGLPMRAQDTINQWLFDDAGNLYALEQVAPPNYTPVVLPLEKILLFRTSVEKGSPLGRSIFRSAYTSWYAKRTIQNIEAVGAERDLAGLPVMRVPQEWLMQGASEEEKQMAEMMLKIVTNIRRDEQEGIVLPSAYDDKGNQLIDLKLLSTGGARSFDTDKMIQRYDHRIAVSALADFLLLGQGTSSSGSWAMHSDKTQLFAKSINAFLDVTAETLNRFAVPELFRLNAMDISDYPKLEQSGIDNVNLQTLGGYLQALTASGAQIFPSDAAKKYCLEIAGIPQDEVDPAVAATTGVDPSQDELDA